MTARQSAAVDAAMRLILRGSTAYAAAKKTGIALSTIYRALERPENAQAAQVHRERLTRF